MMRLLWFEMQKVWQKRSFLALTALLLLLNLFFLWYLNRPSEMEAPLSAYKAVCRDIAGMTEEEKLDYISGLREQAEGVSLVEEVQYLYAQGTEMGTALAAQLETTNPGVYEQYEELYRDGGYLVYTDSLAQECALLEELYEEITAVSGYGDYLETVQENSALSGVISIFQTEEGFSGRNLEKSAADHAGLSPEGIRWYPSRGFALAVENRAADLLLLLSVFLFVGQLILEEKRRGLFAITRATKRGVCVDMGARLLALLLHCALVCLLLYGSALLFAWASAGLGDLSAPLQSMAPCLESGLSVSLAGFLALGFLAKTCLAFFLGILLCGFSICTSQAYVPQLAGIGFLGANWLLYALIPSYSGLSLFKHLSFFGLLRVEALYGGYLNLNLFGWPVSRTLCGHIELAVFLLLGIAAFSNVMAMEDSRGAWTLLSATRRGRRQILKYKWLICLLLSAGISLLPWIFRILSISPVYPMGELLAGIRCIPQFQDFFLNLPILAFLMIAALVQAAAVMLVCAGALLLSGWRKNYFQTLFLAMLFLAAPLVLAQMGLDIMRWFSLWPMYHWT